MPEILSDLAAHNFIDHTMHRHVPSLDPWRAMLKSFAVRLKTPNYLAVLSALNEGIGISLQPNYVRFMTPHLMKIRVDLGLNTDAWIIYREERRNVVRIRVFVDFLLELSRETQASFFS